MTPEDALDYFVQQVREGNLRDYRLRIYYMNPMVMRSFSRQVRSVNDLTRRGYEYRVIISGEGLFQPWAWDNALLNQINADALIPVENESTLTARIYYVFETNRGRKIFDVAMFGDDNWSVFVNGIEFELDEIFYDIIRPHLPLTAVQQMDRFFELRRTSD